jgi:cyclopropane-fatty-acyl-phospholipid synthase
MKSEATQLLSPTSSTGARTAPPRRPSFLARQVIARLARVDYGTLELTLPDQTMHLGEARPGAPSAEISVQDERFWSAVATRGSVGAGEAYAKGWWTSSDPTAVVRLFVRNEAALDGIDSGTSRLSKPLLWAYHNLRRNSERGSRANIAAHYDLSNEFFALFLDETMTYSCGIFEEPGSTLREASIAKIDRLCQKLELRPDDHLLEIGTGWGAFALHAAREYGCRVTTTTISAEQHRLAEQRFKEAGLEDRITLLFEDYRKLEGKYDKLVSVEMIEAVGHQYFDTFFEQCSALLAPDGLMALQAITIADQYYERAKNSVDFIQRYIFPGCCIPSVAALSSSIARSGDLKPVHMEDIGPHYEQTLGTWRRNLLARWDEAKTMGYSEEHLRLWEFYFAYCEGGYAERRLGDVQLLLAKPEARQTPLVPRLA